MESAGGVKRVVLSGVESVGKSVLSERIAARFAGTLVPEYGRTYCEALTADLTPRDLTAIAIGHSAAARKASGAQLLVEDTDVVMTDAWARMMFGGPQADLSDMPSPPALHLLMLPDVPFVADPVRVFGDRQSRLLFHTHVVAAFIDRGLAYVPVGGDWAARERRAFAAVEDYLA